MNSGSNHAGLPCFSLKSLTKVRNYDDSIRVPNLICVMQMFDLRTSDNKQTLLEFLVKIIEQKFSNLSDFHQDLKAVSHAHGSKTLFRFRVFIAINCSLL